MPIATPSLSTPRTLPSSAPEFLVLDAHQLFFKHVIDVLVSSALLALGCCLFAVLAILVRLSSPGPVIFRQVRVGYRGRHFTMYKFRTMTVGDESPHQIFSKKWIRNEPNARQENGDFKLQNDSRITFIGRFLRKWSLDELPQLLNVLRGDMSLVGPRPAIAYELGDYEPWHFQRLGTLPGITGLWQVSGRNRLSFDQMVALDVAYIRNWSIQTDFAILLKTIPTVLGCTGR